MRRLLLRDLQAVPLTPKSYDVLLVFVESRGRFLSKEELMRTLWPDSFVEESNLTQQISTIRKALGENRGEDRFIVTVPGRGYRFAAPVTDATHGADPRNPMGSEHGEVPVRPVATDAHKKTSGADAAKVLEFPQSSSIPSRTKTAWIRLRQPRVIVAALALLGTLCIVIGYALHRESTSARSFSTLRSLAILPFRNLKHEADTDFLSFSLADAIIENLSHVRALTVRPSSSVERYRNQVVDIPTVAAELNVDNLLTGNFTRDGDDLRITSELIDAKTQQLLWKDSFDLKYEKLFTVQERVARKIINRLALNLSPAEAQEFNTDRPIDPLAYEFYLRGVDLYSRGEFPMAIKMLEKSAELNPNYALTWAHLGKSYDPTASFQFGGRDQYRNAETAYEKALSLQPAQIETRVYMANMFTDTGRVEQAVPLLRETLKANPRDAEAHWELGYAYCFAGALDESRAECERARQLDPSVKLNSSALNTYLYLGQVDKFLQSLPRDDDVSLIVFYRGFGEYYDHERERAAIDFDRAFELDRSMLHAQVGKALSHCIRREHQEGIDILRAVESKINEHGVGDPEAIYKVAQAYALLEDRASALRVLRNSIMRGFFPYPYLVRDPFLANLRGEKEFGFLMAVARRRHELFRSRFL